MSESLELTATLTAKNKAFLACLLKGDKTIEAYHKAGYKGDETSAYTLKHRLKDSLSLLINSRTSLDDTLLELDQLDEKELTQQFVTMNQKLRIIALKIQAHKVKQSAKQSEQKQNYTAFIINRGDKATVQIATPIEAQIVDTNDKASQ